MNKSIILGSQADLAQKQNMSLAESFLSAEILILLDCSGSMETKDATGNIRRSEAARKQLTRLQGKHRGKIALICFANYAEYSPNGTVLSVGGSTDMVSALKFAKVADDCGLKIVIISDGEPNKPEKTVQIAQTYTSKIDAIYIGAKFPDDGRRFLERLVGVTGGKFFNDDVGQLQLGVEKLLLEVG